MAAHAQPTFGASIVQNPAKVDDSTTLPLAPLDSPALTPVASRDPPYSDKVVSPHSPFYQHPPASHERLPFTSTTLQTPPSKKMNQFGVSEKDLESGPATPLSANEELNPFTSKVSIDHNKECTMWPSRKTLEMNRLAERRQKHGTRRLGFAGVRHRWATATAREKWMVRIVVAVFVVGAIVGIAVGVTIAVHGGVYSDKGTRPIGDQD